MSESKPERIGGAARGYSWPPATTGNTLAVKHGSYVSEVRLSEDPRVRELLDFILETQPVSHPCDAGAAWRLAMVYRRLEISDAALVEADRAAAEHPTAAYADKSAWLDRLRADHDRWQSRAGKIEDQLGRNPAARAKLGLHLATARRALTVVELHEAAALEAALEIEGEIVEGER